VTTQKPKQESMKTTDISKTRPDETEAWFRSPFTPSDQETHRADSTAPGPAARAQSSIARMG